MCEKDFMKRIILLIFCFWAVSSFAQEIPNNAHKNTYGTGWECDRGYYKSGNECLQVQIPENAQLNYYGHGWECKRGFYKAGNKCLPVQIPKNAQLNYYGHGWECNKGYKKSGNTCVAMSALEIQKQKVVEQAFRIEMERRSVDFQIILAENRHFLPD